MRLVDGRRRLVEQAPCPVYIETHRDRPTTDLCLTQDLLDCFPELKLLGDLSHFLAGREFAWPVSEENHACMRRVIDHCRALHGREGNDLSDRRESAVLLRRIALDLWAAVDNARSAVTAQPPEENQP